MGQNTQLFKASYFLGSPITYLLDLRTPDCWILCYISTERLLLLAARQLNQVNYKCNGVLVLFEQTKGKQEMRGPLSSSQATVFSEGGPRMALNS